MKEYLYSAFGLTFIISGFVMIASLSSSLSPRARSQNEAPQELSQPMQEGQAPAPDPALELPENSGQPAAPELMPAPPVNMGAITPDGQAPVRQDPFIPPSLKKNVDVLPGEVISAPQIPTETPSAPQATEAVTSEEGEKDFFDAGDPYRALALKEYKLAGIIWDVSHPKALFKGQGGKMLTVRRKSILGREGAVVVAVRESEVILLLPGPGGDYEKGTVKILSMRK